MLNKLFDPSFPIEESFQVEIFPFPTMDSNNPHLQNPRSSGSGYFFVPNLALLDQLPTADQSLDQARDHRRELDRIPQWTQAETKELLSVRAELDRGFTQTNRNKPLWEAVATRMQRKGFIRTPEQCKSKWKNLVTRYKGSETMEGHKQFPFHEEMRRILAERTGRRLSFNEGEGEEEEGKKVKKRKMGGKVEEALREFARRQMEREARWMEAAEAREAERRWKEEEWMRKMMALGEASLEMERRWMKREEERHAREEAREEKRLTVISAILSKIAEKEGF